MKKIFAVVLACLLLATFVACGATEDEKVSSMAPTSSAIIIDVAKFAAEGSIEGCAYALGASPETIKTDFHYGDDEYWGIGDTVSSRYNIDAVPLEVIEKDNGEIRMSSGETRFYYNKSDEDKGISFIAHFSDAYGLKVGIASTDTIKTAVDATPAYDGFAEQDDLYFFIGGAEEVYTIKYQFDSFELSFYFMDGKLSATCIKNTEVWTR